MRTTTALVAAGLLVGAGMLAGIAIGRSCSTAAPAVTFDTKALAAIETERAQRAADTEQAKVAITEEAQRRRGLELHERIEVLSAPPRNELAKNARLPVSASRPAQTRPGEEDHAVTEREPDTPAPCRPLGDGWARCQEAALDRLTLVPTRSTVP